MRALPNAPEFRDLPPGPIWIRQLKADSTQIETALKWLEGQIPASPGLDGYSPTIRDQCRQIAWTNWKPGCNLGELCARLIRNTVPHKVFRDQLSDASALRIRQQMEEAGVLATLAWILESPPEKHVTQGFISPTDVAKL